MAKSSVVYECSNCGAQSPKWAGQCSECGKWNTLSETVVSDKISNRKFSNSQIKGKLLGLDEVEGNVGERVSTKIGELDRVLGGGLVSGEVVLRVYRFLRCRARHRKTISKTIKMLPMHPIS